VVASHNGRSKSGHARSTMLSLAPHALEQARSHGRTPRVRVESETLALVSLCGVHSPALLCGVLLQGRRRAHRTTAPLGLMG